jgi:putative ABC transport system ATP-binding protein
MTREAPPRTIVSVRDAGRVYRMGEVDVHALRGASIDIAEGDFLIVVGPSGSGKSTLLNLIGGMDRPTSGSVIFLDRDLTHASDRELTLYRRNEVGFIFQFYNLIPTLTALENVQVATELVDEPMDAHEALELVHLEDRADHFPSQLSGGEQQRVATARALASNPTLLLCDEPTGALDLDTSREVLGMLVDLNRRLTKTVVLITHNSAIAGIGTRVAHIRDGAIYKVTANEHPTPPEEVEW